MVALTTLLTMMIGINANINAQIDNNGNTNDNSGNINLSTQTMIEEGGATILKHVAAHDGENLSMSDAVYNRNTYPYSPFFRWNGNDSYSYFFGEEKKTVQLSDGSNGQNEEKKTVQLSDGSNGQNDEKKTVQLSDGSNGQNDEKKTVQLSDGSNGQNDEKKTVQLSDGSNGQNDEKKTVQLSDGSKGQPEAKGEKAPSTPYKQYKIYSEGGSLFASKGDEVICIAESEEDGIVYGDCVSRNEFGGNKWFFQSPDGSKVAFYRKDERRVTKFPLLNIRTRTGSLEEIRYPMNGMDSELLSIGVYDFAKGTTIYLQTNSFDAERYLTNPSWSEDGASIYIQIVSRDQHSMSLDKFDAESGEYISTLLTEHNDAWIEPSDPLHPFRGFNIYRTDNRDGFRNLYLIDDNGGIRRLTSVDADVEYVANDGNYIYYTSAEVSPIENHLYRIKVSVPKKSPTLSRLKFGKAERLTTAQGWHTINMNPDCTRFIDKFSSFEVPGAAWLVDLKSGKREEIYTASNPIEKNSVGEAYLGTVKSANGLDDNYFRMFLPANFDPTKKYPAIVYVYGGPHSQLVNDSWMGSVRMWEMYMAERGYVVYVQDNRGTQNRGAAFEKAINRQCGKVEMEDQMVGVNMLKSLPFVDAERIGVHGWSYGGYMTISLMTNYPGVFKVGVAGGPVIDWKWYEVMYGERYMDTPETNPEGFEQTSLINKAKCLKDKLLICQGAIDDTVVWEHSLSFVSECISNNIQLYYFPYPTAKHNVMGKDRIHLMDKVSEYFFTNL